MALGLISNNGIGLFFHLIERYFATKWLAIIVIFQSSKNKQMILLIKGQFRPVGQSVKLAFIKH